MIDEVNLYTMLENDLLNKYDLLGLKDGVPFECRKCLVCIDLDASGAGGGYHIHWNCNRRSKSCRGGGSANLPEFGPREGSKKIPEFIKECVKVFEYAGQTAVCAATAYVTWKVVKTCAGGVAGFFVAGPPGAVAGASLCVVTP
jgi:hypothetical protein